MHTARGPISRRRFLLLANAVAVVGLLDACQPATPASPPTSAAAKPAVSATAPPAATQAPAATSAPAATPAQPTPQTQTSAAYAKAPVTFVYADSSDVAHIDPALVVDFWSFTASRNTYEPLVEIDEEKQQVIPWLATSWDVSRSSLASTPRWRPRWGRSVTTLT